MNSSDLSQVRRTLWAAADQLRANSTLAPSEARSPFLGLIFLAYAEHRFEQVRPDIEARATPRRPVEPVERGTDRSGRRRDDRLTARPGAEVDPGPPRALPGSHLATRVARPAHGGDGAVPATARAPTALCRVDRFGQALPHATRLHRRTARRSTPQADHPVRSGTSGPHTPRRDDAQWPRKAIRAMTASCMGNPFRASCGDNGTGGRWLSRRGVLWDGRAGHLVQLGALSSVRARSRSTARYTVDRPTQRGPRAPRCRTRRYGEGRRGVILGDGSAWVDAPRDGRE